jgi:hypothetical protein
MHSVSFLLTLGALTITPTSGGLQAQATLDCKCSQSTGLPASRSFVLQGGGWQADLDATVAAARAELPMGASGRFLFVPGLTFAHRNAGTALMPELEVRALLSADW